MVEAKVFDFASGVSDEDLDSDAPKPFTIQYKRFRKADPETETPAGWVTQEDKFTAKARVSTGLVMSTIGAFARSGSEATAGVLDFLSRALVDEDRLRFAALIDDEDVRLQLVDLGKLTDWLLTEYGERPTTGA